MSRGLQARIYDPLWLLARQWQTGEFQGQDTGSPAAARWRGQVASVARYRAGGVGPGASGDGQRIDDATVPLEALVEREPVRPGVGTLERTRFAVDAGAHFLRLLAAQATSQDYTERFLVSFPLPALSGSERSTLDPEGAAFIDLMAGRVPDGRRLYAALDPALRPAPPARGALPAALQIPRADVAEVESAARAWLDWYASFFSEPTGSTAPWNDERLEYAFSIGASLDGTETVLTAQEYYSGRLDWHDFVVNTGAALGGGGDGPSRPAVQTTIPAPISYRGMPSSRFWAFEDARVDFGSLEAGPEDLARMLLIEFAITYGNDWFVIPIDLDVGTLCRTVSLVVTNTFGERFVVPSSRQAGDPAAAWKMFALTAVASEASGVTPAPDVFFLPPALVTTLESRPVEEVLFLRDEMANMAWGVERTVESAIELPMRRAERQRYEEPSPGDLTDDVLRYQLATSVPDNWVPLVPARTPEGLRLRRGRVLQIDGTPRTVEAQGRILRPGAASSTLALFEEEIPREGVRVTRTYQLARWHDGSTHLWIGRRKSVGRGEGSSGLAFDVLKT